MSESTRNLHASPAIVSREDREKLLGQSGSVLWFTGMSGSGKSTLARQVEAELIGCGRLAYVLDGDIVRRGLCSDLGFSEEDRSENIRRVSELAAILADVGIIVLSAFISPFRSDRAQARDRIGSARFIEIFVDAPLEVCESRDPKGLYRKARSGEIKSFTGIDSSFEPPEAAGLHLKTDRQSIAECVAEVLGALKNYSV
ncbi:MAG: adenylyl-sulfate kinase [Bdellovibrionales bacterium]|nr:adenylyl-sulfate kinase [Bdellovibrionales bacterium]